MTNPANAPVNRNEGLGECASRTAATHEPGLASRPGPDGWVSAFASVLLAALRDFRRDSANAARDLGRDLRGAAGDFRDDLQLIFGRK